MVRLVRTACCRSAGVGGPDEPHKRQDKGSSGEDICLLRRLLVSASLSWTLLPACNKDAKATPARAAITALRTSFVARQGECLPSEARSSGGSFQEILANVFGQQRQDQVGIQPTEAARRGARR
jgi:hypothetical protein